MRSPLQHSRVKRMIHEWSRQCNRKRESLEEKQKCLQNFQGFPPSLVGLQCACPLFLFLMRFINTASHIFMRLIARGRIRLTALKLWGLWVLGKGWSEISSVIVFVEWPWDPLCSELHMAQPFDLTRLGSGWRGSWSCVERAHHWQAGRFSVREMQANDRVKLE